MGLDARDDRNVLFKFTYEDQPYTLTRRDLSSQALIQFRQEWGPDYGKFLTFWNLLLQGDAIAWVCATWLVEKNAGVKPLKPMKFRDVNVAELLLETGDEPDEPEADEEWDGEDDANPTSDQPETTSGLTLTPVTTETSTSGS